MVTSLLSIFPCGQPHERLVAVGPLINEFGSSFAGSRKVKLVLDDFVKRLRFIALAPVIAAALLKYVRDLLISPSLACPDFPDFFQ